MSSRRASRVSQGVTNSATASQSQRPGTASAQLTARLSGRAGGALVGSASTPTLGRSGTNQARDQHNPKLEEGDSPLPRLNGWGGKEPPRPRTTAGSFGRPSPSESGSRDTRTTGKNGRLFTPPRSSPGLSRKEAGRTGYSGSPNEKKSASSGPVAPLYPTNEIDDDGHNNGDGYGEAKPLVNDGSAGIPLGLSKLGREDLEVCVNVVRATLAQQARKDQAAALSSFLSVDDVTVQSAEDPATDTIVTGGQPNPEPTFGRGGSRGGDRGGGSGRSAGTGGRRERNGRRIPRRSSSNNNRSTAVNVKAAASGSGRSGGSGGGGKQQARQNRRRKHRSRSNGGHHHYHHHHHHHHHQSTQGGKVSGGGGSTASGLSSSIVSSVKGGESGGYGGSDGSGDGELSWFARSKGSRTVPLRTLMLDPEVNNIPQVGTQSNFRALIKAQNIPHPSYDIDGDGVVSQEDYALAKRFDINGDGVLDEAEKVVGRRIMTEMFLDNHQHDIHLYGQGLSQKSMAANVDDISRSRGFKKIISGLREKEKNFVNHGSDGVKECVTLKPMSLTRHNFYNNKFDTTAWNDFTRDPREAGWLESRRHDGSRNQMYFMRKVEARESAQGRLNASYRGDDAFSTRRITLITDPAAENA